MDTESGDLDFSDLVKTQKRKGPGKDGAALQNRRARSARLGTMAPIPIDASKDPVKWAEQHIESLAPEAAKEVEYAMKFGSDTMRYVAARDVLAMKGITTKPKDQSQVPVSMTFNVGALPVGPTGVPILPYSNAAKKLLAAKAPKDVDSTATPVTVSKAPTNDSKDPT